MAAAVAGKPSKVARLPLASTATKKIGTPIGTVITSACATEPLSTPRRALALLKANVAADSAARHTPSTRQALRDGWIDAMGNRVDGDISGQHTTLQPGKLPHFSCLLHAVPLYPRTRG